VLTGLAAFLVLFMYRHRSPTPRDGPRAEYLDDGDVLDDRVLDLGFAAPLSAAAGVGMLRGRVGRLVYAIVGWYALTGLAVASAITMRPVSTVANMSAMVPSAACSRTRVGAVRRSRKPARPSARRSPSARGRRLSRLRGVPRRP
jgi:hypothetical protein